MLALQACREDISVPTSACSNCQQTIAGALINNPVSYGKSTVAIDSHRVVSNRTKIVTQPPRIPTHTSKASATLRRQKQYLDWWRFGSDHYTDGIEDAGSHARQSSCTPVGTVAPADTVYDNAPLIASYDTIMSRIDTAIYHVDRFTVAAKENQSFEAAVAAFRRERQAVIESRNLSISLLLTACAQSATSDVGGGAEGLDFAQCHNRHINELLDQRAVFEQRTREPGVPSSFHERIESICSERIEADDTWSGNWRDPEVWSLSLGAIRDRDLTDGEITALELHRKTLRAVVVACRDIVARDRFPSARHRFEVEFSRRPSHLQPLSRTICMILFDAEWRDLLVRVTPESLAYWQIVRDLLYDKTISLQSRDVESGPPSAWDLEMYRQIYHTTAPLLWQSRIAAGTKQHVTDFATGALQAIERQYDALAPISAQLEMFACGPGPVKVPGRSKDVGKDVVAASQTRKQSPYAGDEQ